MTSNNNNALPRCRWRRSGSLPEARQLWTQQGVVNPRLTRQQSTTTTTRNTTNDLTRYIHEARSLEHLQRLSVLGENDRVIVPVASNAEGSSFHIYNNTSVPASDFQHQAFLQRSEQLFSNLGRSNALTTATSPPTLIQITPSEIEF